MSVFHTLSGQFIFCDYELIQYYCVEYQLSYYMDHGNDHKRINTNLLFVPINQTHSSCNGILLFTYSVAL